VPRSHQLWPSPVEGDQEWVLQGVVRAAGAEEDILHRCRVRRAGLQLTVAVYRGATATGRGVKVAVIGTGSLD